MTPATYLNQSLIPFYARGGVKYRPLSNLTNAPLIVTASDFSDVTIDAFPQLVTWLDEPTAFASSEHLWHALKATNVAMFREFAAGGRFDELTVKNMLQMLPKSRKGLANDVEVAKKKVKFWRGANGIMPKLASSPKRWKKLGISAGMDNGAERGLSAKVEEAVWVDILKAKFRCNDEHRDVLISTNGCYLLEFSRGGKRSPATTYWAGLIDRDGVLYGRNMMGRYLMKVREILLSE